MREEKEGMEGERREGRRGKEERKERKEGKKALTFGTKYSAGEAAPPPFLRSFGRSGQLGTEGHHGM